MHFEKLARWALFIVVTAVVSTAFAQQPVAHKNMLNSGLAEVQLTSKLDLQTIDRMGGNIDWVGGNVARVYLLPEDFEQLRASGFSLQWIPDEGKLSLQDLWNKTRNTRDPLDAYHTNDEIRTMFANWQTLYPTLFKYDSIGMSVLGRPLLVAKLSDNVTADEPEIETKYVANIHGDETVGKENCLRFIDTLLTGYGIDPELTELMTDYEMWFLPLMNPDGNYSSSRFNANGYDLNRTFPDRCDDSVNTTTGRPIEVANVMNWTAGRNFILSANFHGGALVANYPWDNNCTGGAVYAPTQEDCLFVYISRKYSYYNTPMWNNSAFPPCGITNGADWYELSGGMQDWNYVWMGDRELTLEISNTKNPAASQLEQFWRDNRRSMRYYLLEAKYGVRGTVTDVVTGQPIRANISVNSIPYLTFSSALHGEYYRMLRPGTYSISFSASGYGTQTHSVTVLPNSYTTLNVQLGLPPDIAISPDTVRATIGECSLGNAAFTIINNGGGPLTWSAVEGYSNYTGYGSSVGGGWRFVDSDHTGGPVYSWKDISTTGTLVSFSVDDQTLGPYSIGFSFPYFGQSYTTFRICGNGWISFTSTSTAYENGALPSASAPLNMLAAWWDDLSPHRSGAQVRYWSNNTDTLVVTFSNVQSYADGGVYTFQFILLSSGKIAYQYNSMGTLRLNSSTIGLQDAAGVKGMAVINNQTYIHNAMAIDFCPHSMLTPVPLSGTVGPMSSQRYSISVNTCCAPLGAAAGILAVSSNDPDTPLKNVPVVITVVDAPPDPVTNLTISTDGDTVLLHWSAVPTASGYLVYRMTTAEQDYLSGERLTAVPITATSYTDTVTAAAIGIRIYQVVSVR